MFWESFVHSLLGTNTTKPWRVNNIFHFTCLVLTCVVSNYRKIKMGYQSGYGGELLYIYGSFCFSLLHISLSESEMVRSAIELALSQELK